MIELADRVRELLGPRGADEIAWRGAREPLVVAAPASVEELRELVRWSRAQRVPIVPLGLGSKLGWGPPARVPTLGVSTRRLQQLVEYEPGEGVITALAGTRMSSLRELARAQGHWLTPDVPCADGATLGGVVAAGQSASDRMRFGPVRHHVLGMRCVLADATLTKCGGRLVKNVTGFDLQRLYTGSRGTLCIVVEVSLRLFAAPREEALVRTRARDAHELCELAKALESARVRPYALAATRERSADAPWTLHAHLGGLASDLRAQLDHTRAAWKDFELAAGPSAGDDTSEASARTGAAQLRDSGCDASRETSIHVACSPIELAGVLAALESALGRAELGWRAHVQPAVAAVDVELSAFPGAKLDSAKLGAVLESVRGALAAFDAPVALRNPTKKLAATNAPWAPLGPGVALMQRVREKLDPDGVFARGRFTEEL